MPTGQTIALPRPDLNDHGLPVRTRRRGDALQNRSFYEKVLPEFLAGHSSAFDDNPAEAYDDLPRRRPQKLRCGCECGEQQQIADLARHLPLR